MHDILNLSLDDTSRLTPDHGRITPGFEMPGPGLLHQSILSGEKKMNQFWAPRHPEKPFEVLN